MKRILATGISAKLSSRDVNGLHTSSILARGLLIARGSVLGLDDDPVDTFAVAAAAAAAAAVEEAEELVGTADGRALLEFRCDRGIEAKEAPS